MAYIPLTEYIKFTTVNCILNQGIFSLANRMPKHADLHDQYKDFHSTDSSMLRLILDFKLSPCSECRMLSCG